jgi:hypothetical protein
MMGAPNPEERRLARAARDGWDKPVPPEHEFCRVDVLAVTDALARTLNRLEAAERERDQADGASARYLKQAVAAESALVEARKQHDFDLWTIGRALETEGLQRSSAGEAIASARAALAARPGEQK